MPPSNRDARRISTLRSAVVVYLHFGSTMVLMLALACAVVARVLVGDAVTLGDLVVVVSVGMVAPFVEFVIHRGVLHRRPLRLGSHLVDVADGHRRHHREPTDLASIPLRATYTVGYVVVVGAALSAIGGTYGLATGAGFPVAGIVTASAGASVAMARYEWLHLLMHTSYRARRQRTRVLIRNHRLHHYRNEGFWLGVTSNLGDRVAGTLPSTAGAVLVSDTARTLGADL